MPYLNLLPLLSSPSLWPSRFARPRIPSSSRSGPRQPRTKAANMGPERVVPSPVLDRKQVEVTASTRMLTGVTRPTLTLYRPARDKDCGAM